MSAPPTKLFVGHLPDRCKNEELQSLFERYGTVKECDVISKYGFVHMSTAEEAQIAIKALNNYNFKGSSLSVEQSKSKLHHEPGSNYRSKAGRSRGGFRGSFRGGSRGDYSNGYGSPFNPSRSSSGLYGDYGYSNLGASRMRPYPSPYERPLPSPYERRDDYYRSPYSSLLRDSYASPMTASPRQLYERPLTSYPSSSNYLYSRRSPVSQIPPPTRSYWQDDSVGELNPRLPPAPMTRNEYF